VRIEGRRVTIEGKERGPRQHGLDLVKAEWSIGPYHREIDLPENVDGALANATYGNGVLVVTLPKAKSAQRNSPTEFTLQPMGPTRGEHIGHMGHDILQTTTQEHLDRLAQIPGRAPM